MTIDVVFLMVAAYGFYVGFGEGIIRAVFSILSIGLGMMAALKFSPAMSKFLEVGFKTDNPLIFGLGFVLTFFGSMWLIRMFAGVITDAMAVAHVNLVNQLIGGIALSGIFIILMSMMVWFANEARMIDPETKAQSMAYRFLEPLPGETKDAFIMLKPTFEEFWQESSKMMDKMKQQGFRKSNSTPNIYSVPDDNGQKSTSR